MKKMNIFGTAFVAAAMIAGIPVTMQAQQNNAQVQSQDTKAYNDGVMAAKLDKAANRKIDATTSHLYVKPPVKKDAQDAYRAAFKKGYDATAHPEGM